MSVALAHQIMQLFALGLLELLLFCSETALADLVEASHPDSLVHYCLKQEYCYTADYEMC